MRQLGKVLISSLARPRYTAGNWQARLLFRRPVNADSAKDVAGVLLDYFQARLGVSSLAFVEAPQAFTDGRETYCYGFQLKSPDPLPPAFAQPLMARIYASPAGLPRARHEILVQRHLYKLNYPVPEPLLLEEDCAYLGGPFLIVAQIQAQTLLHTLLSRPWKILSAPARMAEAHVQLHQLPTEGFPGLPRGFLDRRLEEMADIIRDHGLHGLQPGLAWLSAHRPGPPQDPKILHLDFHPLNLIDDPNHSLVVIDWNEAELGDPHADVGTTLMLMECLPPIDLTRLDRFSLYMGRLLFVPGYLHTYQRHMALEKNKLAYYRALAGFRRLCNYGRWLQDGPQISGDKPAMLQCITDTHRQALERYFRKWTGVSVRL